MKYDVDYLREILALLIENESSTANLSLFDRDGFAKGFENQQELDRLYYHLKILQDHDVFEILNGGTRDPNSFGFMPDGYGQWHISVGPLFRVTAKGHEFYEQTRDRTIWEKSKNAAEQYGFGIVMEFAKDYAKQTLMGG